MSIRHSHRSWGHASCSWWLARRSLPSGQALVEFALVIPVLLLLLVGIADFARWYSAAITVESAAREAADYGAFTTSNWATSPVNNVPGTEAEMRKRACTAASTLLGYQGDPPGSPNMTCSNPSFSYVLENPAGVADCSSPGSSESCRVHVTMTFTFSLFIGGAPLPSSITFSRDSVYAISPLPVSP